MASGPARQSHAHPAPRLIAVTGLVLILSMTLWPHTPSITHPPPSPWCMRCGDGDMADIVLNLLLFTPLGAGLALVGMRPRAALPLATALTIAIELLQSRVIPGRDASLRDVLCNALGAALGMVLAAHWREWLLPVGRRARWSFRAMLLLSGAVLCLTAWGLTPDLPGKAWWVQLDPRGQTDVDFPGTLLSASLGEGPLEDGRAANIESLRARMRRPPVVLELRLVAGGAVDGTAPVFGLVTEDAVDVLRVSQQGGDALLGYDMRSARLRLGIQIFRLPGALAGAAADTVDWRAAIDGRRVELSASHADGRVDRMAVGITPGMGWSLLWPFNPPNPIAARMLSLIWMFLLPLPAGYFAWFAVRAGSGPGSSVALAALLAIAGGGLAPLAAGLAPMSLPEWGAAALGACTGWLAAPAASRLARAA
jgi:VanZ family protein